MKINLFEKTYSIFNVIIFLSSCANPTFAVEPEIEQFKKNFSRQIQIFHGQNGPMGYAWSGDPSKRPLLLIHGSPGSWEGWSHFLLDLELQKRFQLIAVDRPGYGQSQPGVAVPSLAAQAADVMEVLKINQSHLPAILVGHSYGGPVIAKAAMDFPEQVVGLVFVASSVDPELESTKWFQYPATWWLVRWMIPSDLRVCNEEILPLKSELKMMLPFWKNIKVRSVLIQGEKDDLVPKENLDFLTRHLNPETVVKIMRVPGMNHFIPWKGPELIIQGIQEVDHALSK